MRMFSTQIPYDATQGVAQDTHLLFQYVSNSHALHRAIITSLARQRREEPHPPTPTGSTVLRVSGFTDPHGTMERKQWDGLIERWSYMTSYRSPRRPAGGFTWDASSRWFEVPQWAYAHGDRQWDFKRSEPISFIVSGLPGKHVPQAINRSQRPGRSNVSKRGWDHFLQVFGMTIPAIFTPLQS